MYKKIFILFSLILVSLTPAFCQGWLELPAAGGEEGCLVSTQYMDVGPYHGRSHTYSYDPALRISRWVAYPLNAGLIGEGSRGEGWHPYEGIPEAVQPALFKGFKYGSGFDRGHQIPSADRLESKANEATFVYVNATPQRHDFNGGIWAELEKVVRTWAKRSDTLYVVTGASAGKQFVKDNNGNPVNVPEAYYKACLRKNTDRTGRVHWSMCAVLLPHDETIPVKTWAENLKYFQKHSLSIDELENIVKEDFFPNLHLVIGKDLANAMETINPADNNWWWR